MKRILLTGSLFAAFAVMFTSCLKDKGFDNGLYGINDPDTQPPGVGFPFSAKANNKNQVGVNVATSVQAINGVVYVNLLTGQPAQQDVHVTIAVNDALRTAYNAANNPDLLPLTAAQYSLGTTITIPAGQRSAQIPVNITNSSLLDPNSQYGLGITITGVDGGYTIADNLKNLLLEISVKNQYHGDYIVNGYVYHPTAPRPLVDWAKPGITSGAQSIDMDLGDLGSAGYKYRLHVNPVTNKVTLEAAPGAAGAPYTQFDNGLPTTAPGYTPAWSGSALTNNARWDPATKTFYFRGGYVGATGWRVSEEIAVKQ